MSSYLRFSFSAKERFDKAVFFYGRHSIFFSNFFPIDFFLRGWDDLTDTANALRDKEITVFM